MGEVCEMFDLQPSTIRHWEREIPQINPTRNAKGNRLFDKKALEALRLVYHLVKEQGMTLDGAKRSLKSGNYDVMNREAELLERLMKIRAELVEVREELKDELSVVVAENTLFEAEPVEQRESVVQRFDKDGEPIVEPTPAKARRGRRRKSDTDKSRELFAYFEQQLF
ncbi:MAG: MerR family transcriptional regulator [Rikenellaceae bacterium]